MKIKLVISLVLFLYLQNVGALSLKKIKINLYFSNSEFLTAEERIVLSADDPAVFGRVIILELLQGPRTGLKKVMPHDTAIRALYIADNTAYVDFNTAIKEHHPGSIIGELTTIYAIVNSLILNVPEIKAVKILINGAETETLAGHIDLRSAFGPNMLMIR